MLAFVCQVLFLPYFYHATFLTEASPVFDAFGIPLVKKWGCIIRLLRRFEGKLDHRILSQLRGILFPGSHDLLSFEIPAVIKLLSLVVPL